MMGDKLLFENVSKVYGEGDNKVIALDDISLNVRAGEFVAIVGPSGSGKSTFLSIAGALLSPSKGRLLLNGEDITTLSPKELTRVRLEKIGFVFQSSNLVPYLSVRDQLLLLSELIGKRDKTTVKKADELLSHLGLGHRAGHLPEALSGGERQRVAIARSLMNDPEIILADEPTASLDSKRGRDVVEMLAHEVKSRNKAAIMVTHDERMLDLCDRVVNITDGKVLG
ncbi:ABC transporter ATP-binding protein [Peribacillus castrilensis]|uniref:Putative hemin import ATP-binding protein HrtA n=1 Tax=Peribacillus simplex TaxID=1478 RepID=A0AAN2PDH8_9BACI|nr:MULTISPECIES: ABC transporter ATP-binding protein [Peribacillus]MBD8588178.1 ABC transporter ATP-binding protein [Peribacillus simplex]MCP1151310.1 ABC transporter ATP-binding protein [Peribacillus frigoritolerans]MCT1388951.1 ABC transporter ATP-binding protein [Peribacillus frigoritolerans]MEA3575086.1 ABC transporter ATP-binding protein [Peribacillus frigoritolerans]CEG30592.1 ABC transporter ATP-binding protein [Peribacillus simplex]